VTTKSCRWQTLLSTGVVYALAVVLMTLPASCQLSSKLIGNNVDNWIFYWNNWWIERAIAEGRSWFECPYIFYPHGINLVTHSHSFLNSLLAIAIKPLAGPMAAYNLVLLLGLWVGAMGMFLLAHEMTGRTLPALLSGFVFAFAPYHLSQALAHPHLGSIHWWPFYILFLRRTIQGHQVVNALWAGLFAALTLWSGLQLAVLLALWTALYVGWHVLLRRATPRSLGLIALACVAALALSVPLLIPVARESRRLAEIAKFNEGTLSQTDLLAYLLPPTYHPLLGPHTGKGYERFVTNQVAMPYLGYTVVGLTLAALLTRRKESAFWAISSMIWIVLAAGSTLRLNGTLYTGIPLPYRLVGQLFPISTIRAPDRFNLLVVPSLAVLAGLGAAYLAQKRRWLLVPLSLLIIFEYVCVPVPTWDMLPSSAFFEQMAQEETLYGIVDYPMGYTSSKLCLYYQTLHGKPIVEGHISRYTADDYAFIASNSLLRTLYQVAERPVRLPEDTFTGDPLRLGPALQELRASGVRYILLHKPYADAALQAHFQNTLPLVPVYEDANLAAYDLNNLTLFCYDGLPIPLTSGAALARFDVQPADEAWRIQILAGLSAPRTSPLACKISLLSEGGDELELPVTLFEAPPEMWQAGAVDLQTLSASLPPRLEPGAYRWSLTCPEVTADYVAPDTLYVDADGHAAYLRQATEILYGEAIRLQGYRWWTAGTNLHIALHWKAERDPAADYKVFVHLLNAEGALVRQYDAVPCSWQCPTSHWQAGDAVTDRATISLAGLPPGEYRLAVGLYDAGTGERLPASESDGERYSDAYPILTDAFSIKMTTHE
jgi:hypothetical protein